MRSASLREASRTGYADEAYGPGKKKGRTRRPSVRLNVVNLWTCNTVRDCQPATLGVKVRAPRSSDWCDIRNISLDIGSPPFKNDERTVSILPGRLQSPYCRPS